ncbi:hypothetical protein CKAN_00543200 [Cinnamomum micranthum f. kanehirae]|uniref:Uncharacterized protein n=1 Tax=Cinnamomum micranthum f. kanehirae TaxID=337451 RepID=A0A3S3NX84_9MAGN|nr:hypothetical protein CKAN_00543200 [Cinnamomum micranthum f. kanehirae]
MGNALTSCFTISSKSSVKIVFWKGTTNILTGKHSAGEIMSQFPDSIVCHADSFYIGHPIHTLSIEDELLKDKTYFILPVDRFANRVLSTAMISSLASSHDRKHVKFTDQPFKYVKGSDGQMMIKVLPEFMMKIILGGDEEECNRESSPICSTPELQKHYDQMVGSKEQMWSPKLETILEYKARMSPCGLLGLEWRSGKMEG